MDTLTDEEALLKVSRSPVTPTNEKLDAAGEVDCQADDGPSTLQVGVHGSHSFSVHVLTLPPFVC
jgi:hypothetical protein